MTQKPHFNAGQNIAMKVPPQQYQETVRFYGEILGLEKIEPLSPATVFRFGDKQLWIDRVEGLSSTEVWLEIVTDHMDAAAKWLAKHNVERCDDIEQLPDGLNAFWVTSPAAVIHLINETVPSDIPES